MRESEYLTEAHLQELIARYPSLLAGDQFDPNEPRRWVFVKREAGLADSEDGAARWAVDHLFIDQEGIPTLVEVKRSTDARIRREVVGQMLDYAANAVAYLPIATIRDWFTARCAAEHLDPQEVLRDDLGWADSVEDFWARVETNRDAGRVRLVFVADHIPDELRRVIEFLNRQMRPAEVFGLELPQFVHAEVGQTTRALVPRIVGRTAEAERAKGRRSASRAWDDKSFFEALAELPTEAEIGKRLIDWLQAHGCRHGYGRGGAYGTLFGYLDAFGTWYPLFALWSTGSMQLQLGTWRNRPVTNDPDVRQRFLGSINLIDGITIPLDRVDKFPTFPASALATEANMARFLAAVEQLIDFVRGAERSRSF
jgi:hypothetical protein